MSPCLLGQGIAQLMEGAKFPSIVPEPREKFGVHLREPVSARRNGPLRSRNDSRRRCRCRMVRLTGSTVRATCPTGQTACASLRAQESSRALPTRDSYPADRRTTERREFRNGIPAQFVPALARTGPDFSQGSKLSGRGAPGLCIMKRAISALVRSTVRSGSLWLVDCSALRKPYDTTFGDWRGVSNGLCHS